MISPVDGFVRSYRRTIKLNRTVVWLGGVIVLLAMARPTAQALEAAAKEKSGPMPCAAASVEVEAANDMEGLKAYGQTLRELLRKQDFKELDCIADSERVRKDRFPGGTWKLHEFYWAITKPQGHATREDWDEQLKLVQSWVDAVPQSITARVALAESYSGYAWDARGNDTSETVTENGWKLFAQRLEKAKTVLEDAATLPSKCPEWYFAMQQVALGQQWDRDRVDDLFKRAIASEPAYYYYYRSYAYYLMPQWNGEDGDATKFAQQSADRVGGDAGDVLYFQIGEKILCACNEPEFSRMSWPRLQKGHALLEKQYGPSLFNLNSLALMAVKNNDWLTANDAFQRIGDNVDKTAWITETYFNQNKAAAAQIAPQLEKSRASLREAAANSQTAEGAEYQKKVEQALLPLIRQCVLSLPNDREKLEFAVQVGKDGSCDNLSTLHMTSAGQCMLQKLYEGHVKNESPFPPPPRPGYWVDLLLDPVAISTTAAK